MTLRRAGVYWGRKNGGEIVGPDYSNATLVYSIQKLVPLYTGHCWLVRRVSDSATQNIGFDVNGLVDEAALFSFLGTGQGRLITWYDQIGLNNATAPTTSNEPLIWDNGFKTFRGKPSIDFEGSNNRILRFTEIEWISSNGIFCLLAGIASTSGAIQAPMGHSTLNRQMRFGSSLSPSSSVQLVGSPNDFPISLLANTDVKIVGYETYVNPTKQGKAYIDTFESSLTSYTATTWKFNQLGAVLSSSIPYGGFLSEFIFYDDVTLLDIPFIKNERINYYL